MSEQVDQWVLWAAGFLGSAFLSWNIYLHRRLVAQQERFHDLDVKVASLPTSGKIDDLTKAINILAGNVQRLEGYLEARDGRQRETNR